MLTAKTIRHSMPMISLKLTSSFIFRGQLAEEKEGLAI